MSKRLEAALAAEKKAAERRAGVERHERLVALSVEQLKLVRAKDYAKAEESNVEANIILQAIGAGEAATDTLKSLGGEQPQKET